MHKEILNPDQIYLLDLVRQFKKEFFLVGGTAIALYIGHRRSVDFDLFKFKSIKPKSIIEKIALAGYPYLITRRVTEQLNININNVKFTFYQYPFEIDAKQVFKDFLRIPELIDLAAMKAYALGRRNRWKDYVDLYFLLKFHMQIEDLISKASEIFSRHFNAKLFREQLCFFDDLDDSETIDYLDHSPENDEIKNYLESIAIDI